MTVSDGRSPAANLADTLADAAVVVDADDRVLAWNEAAAAQLGIRPQARGRSLAELGLAGVPGATRLALAAGTADDAAALVTWPTAGAPTDADIARQKLRALTALASGVDHEGRNYHAGFSSFFMLLRLDDAFIANYGESLVASLEWNAKAAPELLGAYAELARHREPEPKPQPVRARLELALLLTKATHHVERDVVVPVDLPEALADRSRLHQALVAILVNAVDAFGGARGHLAITASATEGAVEVAFEDDAPTVPERDRAHLFDRLPPPGTTARAGLDLAVARHLLERDRGTLRYEPGPAGGNRFVLTLPVDAEPEPEPAPVPEPEPEPVPEPVHRRLTVLVCDDEASIRDLIGRIMDRDRHVTLKAASGAEALEILDGQPVDIVMADHHMARMSGVELYRAACDRHPHLRRRFVFMSGDPDDQELRDFAVEAGLPVLGKPFSFTKLEATIRQLAGA